MGWDFYVVAEQSKKALYIDRGYNLLPFETIISDDYDLDLDDIELWGNILVRNVFVTEQYSFAQYKNIYNKVYARKIVSSKEMKMLAYISGAIWEEFGGERKDRAEVCCDIMRFCSLYPEDEFKMMSFGDFMDAIYENHDLYTIYDSVC